MAIITNRTMAISISPVTKYNLRKMAGIEKYPGALKDMTAGTTKEFCIRVRRRTESGTIPEPLSDKHHFYIALAKDRDIYSAPDLEIFLTPQNGESTVYGQITSEASLHLLGGYFYIIKWLTPSGTQRTIDKGIVKITKPV